MMNPGISLISESVMSVIVPLIFIATIDLRLLVTPLIFLVFLSSRYGATWPNLTLYPPLNAFKMGS